MELEVEVARPAGSEDTGLGEKARDAMSGAFEHAQEAIVAVATSTVDTIEQLGSRTRQPDEVQVKFGLKFSAKGNVIVAGASSEATLEVALTYRATAEHGVEHSVDVV
ncbi:CU044_2847 family protein [Nocardioides sp. NPDC059952]|uniref:CU044_2847 family protein n=1 Tax=Nocardioides sp. NPDC059952 TaxID=3347014 RepID=UPI0036513B9C